MIKDLVNITLEEIEESASHSVESDNTVIMYLQNTGDKEYKWDASDISAWFDEDLDD